MFLWVAQEEHDLTVKLMKEEHDARDEEHEREHVLMEKNLVQAWTDESNARYH